VFSLLSTKTESTDFSFLRGVQGQFVDRTQEDKLRREKDHLVEEQLKNQSIIKQKSERLEEISKRLASYLSPQVYDSIFQSNGVISKKHQRKNLTVFFSDIVSFTELSDTLEPEVLAALINNYLSEMTNIAIECGGTIDKFIGDAVMVFFGDPQSNGERQDALSCVEMAAKMQNRIAELQTYWKTLGIRNGMQVRMGISTGYCTVGDFGSQQRLDYTAFGSPVNLAARLETLAPAGSIIMSEATQELVGEQVGSEVYKAITPKGFSAPVNTFILTDHNLKLKVREAAQFKKQGSRVSIDIFDTSDIRAAIAELKEIELEFERLIEEE
jgi:class 3 adenylate cyclase